MAKGEVVPRKGKFVDPMERIAIALERLADHYAPNGAKEAPKVKVAK